jgi:vesicle-associated membrane protein 72
MPLIYGAVARGSVILAEFSVFSGNFGTVTRDFLGKMHNTEGKFTYTVDQHTFNFNVDQGYTYVAVADEATGRVVPMAFLDKMKGEFMPKYGEKGKTAAAASLSNSFG